MPRVRLDKLLVERGLADGRSAAMRLIESGRVSVSGEPYRDPRGKVLDSARLTVTEGDDWVSRGALKLLRAFEKFPQFNVSGKRCLDVGASTGGFTQVLLHQNAAAVAAVDVGSDQLHPSLREDQRVTAIEQCDARTLSAKQIGFAPEVIVCDASFISASKVLQPALDLAAPGAQLITLVKPQFECGPGHVNKQGIVTDPAAIAGAQSAVEAWINEQKGWSALQACDIPFLSDQANQESLWFAQKKT